MSPRRARSLLLCLALALPGWAPADAPQRVLSLDLCMDWALAHYLPAARIAALSPLHERYPLPGLVDRRPSHDGSLERIVQLQPDLVLVGQYNALLLRERLRSLGLRVEVLALPTTLAELEAHERRLLQLLGGDPAQATPAPAPRAPTADAPRLLLLGANGIGTGRATFEQQIMEQAGWRNYVAASGYVALDLEQVASDPPEALLFSAPDRRALAYRFAQHPALRKRVPAARWLSTDYWRWQCPGPWTWDLIRQLEQWRD